MTISDICQRAKIIDLETNAVHSFVTLFKTEQAKPKKPFITLGDATGRLPNLRSYLVCWGDALATHTLTRKLPEQFTPAEIEGLYEHATALKPRKLRKEA